VTGQRARRAADARRARAAARPRARRCGPPPPPRPPTPQRVYQFHEDPQTYDITEHWSLGVFDAAATRALQQEQPPTASTGPGARAAAAWLEARRAALLRQRQAAAAAAGDRAAKGAGGKARAGAAAEGEAEAGGGGGGGGGGGEVALKRLEEGVAAELAGARAPPMLEPLDLLPDQPAMMARAWPCVRQAYGRGDACGAEGRKGAARRVEVRAACSPDGRMHMLVREPDFCRWGRRPAAGRGCGSAAC
jgi:hypothetical protein